MSSELARRSAVTLGALLVYRIGTYIPIPGIDPVAWAAFFQKYSSGVLGSANIAAGGGIARISILSLGIAPYVTAGLLLALLSFFFRRLRLLQSSGERGRKRLQTITRLLTLAMTLLQSFGIANALDGIDSLTTTQGARFVVPATLTMAGGTMFLIWLTDQITARGLGNGIALLLSCAIVLDLPKAYLETALRNEHGFLTNSQIIGHVAIMAAMIFVIALMERARRRERIDFANGATTASSAISLKFNSAGIVPAIVASSLMALPLPLASYFGRSDPARWREVAAMFDPGKPLYLIGFALFVLFCVYLYTAMVFDPDEAAEKLQRLGGTVPGVAPGEPTAIHLDRVLSRTTLVGAVYFVAICLIPEVLLSRVEVPFFLGGTSLLILVCTVLDVESQARQLARIS